MADPHPLILALGDSLVAGYGLAPADGFAARLQARLRERMPHTRVIGAGVSGSTAADVLRRLPAVLSRLATRPDLAIVQVGPNDVLRQVPPAVTRAGLDAILTELSRCDIPALLTTVDPPPILRDRAAGYLGIHAEAAAAHDAALCAFFPPDVLGRADMVLADRVHPNAAAIAAVVDAMLPAIDAALGRRDTRAA